MTKLATFRKSQQWKTGLNMYFKIKKKKKHYITMQSMNKNIKIYHENYKITKENELRFDVPGILL